MKPRTKLAESTTPYSGVPAPTDEDWHWWNRPDKPIIDLKVPRDEMLSFGIYTVSEQIL